MSMSLHRRRLMVAVMLLAGGTAACDLGLTDPPVAPQFGFVEPSGSGAGLASFDAYTQNVYLGGDTGPLFTIDLTDLPAVLAATSVFWSEVQSSGVPERVAAIVDEIAMRRPHAVGLQEVLQFAVLDGSFQPIGGIDLLAAIEGEIAARGLPYETTVVQPTTSAPLPLAFDPAVGVTQWLHFTDRVVILTRSDAAVTSTAQGTYAAVVPLGPVDLVRGWARVSVDHGGTPHHFVTTHLEVQALAPVQAAQAQELIGGVLAGLDGVTVLGGDLNSDAEAQAGDPSWTPTYDQLLAAGFADVWELAPHSRRDSGFTCCQDPSLTNSPSALSQRIDFVLVRFAGDLPQPDDVGRGFFRADVVGDESADRTPTGLWPSDHGGVAAGIRMEPADSQ